MRMANTKARFDFVKNDLVQGQAWQRWKKKQYETILRSAGRLASVYSGLLESFKFLIL